MILRSSIALILSPEYEALAITNRKSGGFGLPGGKEEGDEGPLRCLDREVDEELGIKCVMYESSLLSTSTWGDGRIVSVFLVRSMQGWPIAREAGTEIRWLSLPDLVKRSPFGAFYANVFPQGFGHLRPTLWTKFGSSPEIET